MIRLVQHGVDLQLYLVLSYGHLKDPPAYWPLEDPTILSHGVSFSLLPGFVSCAPISLLSKINLHFTG